MTNIIILLDNFIWGYFMMFLLVGVGLYLSIRMRFVQIRFFKHAWSLISGKWDNPKEAGELSHFKTLTTALSATVGTGNIAGVATAVASGGPGAIFWMLFAAFLGMCTKFTCCILAMLYRDIDEEGEVSGGPMYYLKKGLNMPRLGFAFALFTTVAAIFGIGNLVQANSVAEPLFDYYGFPKIYTGLILSILTGIVILGGVKRIAVFSSKIVPIMAALYILGSLTILFKHIDLIPMAFITIVKSAFGIEQVGAGALGFTVSQAMHFGVARGLFSNEAGLGSAPIAHATAKTSEPVRVGIVAMLEPFIDTIIICAMTGLVVIISGLYIDGQSGATLTSLAFEKLLPGFGKLIVLSCIVLFAFSTLVSWSYYGDRSVKYMFPKHSNIAVNLYRWTYILLIPLGATTSLTLIWKIADIANGFMALPNLIALIGLSSVVSLKLKDFENRYSTMQPYNH